MTTTRKNILAILGSTRADSVNLHILNFIATMYAEKAIFNIYRDIDQLPHFNPDIDNDPVPIAVSNFRKMVQNADGVLICTPEYVYSLPGSLKNAIEWTVSTILFTNKRVALITAASSGQKAQEALNLLMTTIGAIISSSILIKAPKTKISVDGEITDESTLMEIQQMMDTFIHSLFED